MAAEDIVPEPILAFVLGKEPIRNESNNKRSSTESNIDLQPSLPHPRSGKLSFPPDRDQYDPYLTPPNLKYSKIHQKSRRVLRLQEKFEEDNESLEDYCPCCNYPIEGKRFPLFCDIRRLNELGEGIPLYYDMVKFLLVMLTVGLLVAGVYSLVKNYLADHISEYDSNLSGHLILTGTLGTVYTANFGESTVPPALEPWLHVVVTWLMMAMYYILAARHKRLNKELDISAITPSDYTAMLTNLPEVYNPQDLKEFLEINGRPDNIRCEVVKINIAYRCSDLVNAKLKLENLKGKLVKAEKMQIQHLEPPVPCLYRVKDTPEGYQSQIQTLENTITTLQNDRSQGTGVAFVTFIQDEGKLYTRSEVSYQVPGSTGSADYLGDH